MNRDEITAKIAELEKKIQMDKLQNAGADDAGKVTGRTRSGDIADAMRCALAVAAVKEHTSSGCTEHLQSMDLWTRLQPYQELP